MEHKIKLMTNESSFRNIMQHGEMCIATTKQYNLTRTLIKQSIKIISMTNKN